MKKWLISFLSALLLIQPLAPAFCEEVRWPSYNGVYQFTENGKVGLKDDAGNILLECEFDFISYWFQDGFAIVKKDGEIGYINQQWQLVLPPVGDAVYIDEESEGITSFKHYRNYASFDGNEKCGFLDVTTGELFFLPYYRIGYCQEGLMRVWENDLVGFIDKTGELVIDCRWLSAANFTEGKALAEDEEGFLFIDRAGNPLFGKHWPDALPFSGGCAPVCNGTHWGLIDAEGNLLTDYLWDEMRSFGSVVFMRQGDFFGLLDSKGNILFEPQWNEVNHSFPCDEATIVPVMKDGLYGYVNREGKLIQETRWADDASFSSEEYVVAQDDNGLFHLIDYDGNILFSSKTRIFDIGEGRVITRTGWWGNGGVLDMQGNEIVPCVYSDIGEFREGLCAVQQNGKWGYINSSGEVVIPFQFDTATEFVDGVAWVTVGDTECMIDKNGTLLSGLFSLPDSAP